MNNFVNEKDIIYEEDLNMKIFYYYNVYFIDIYEIIRKY